ncbi:MAG: PfkB family carbohydrate kinase [Puniceicoccales bacterium]|jgi:sugar/nucleoside kinase (ribokinase family)|nr:PfkB family carbohydrate kinase [Puniceicoccales bacterium]
MSQRIVFPTIIAPSAFPGVDAPQSLLVSGTVAYDDIITPKASGKRLLGGSASYAALAAAFFTDSRLAGIVGGDFAEKDRKRLRSHGVDLDGLHTEAAGKTFFWSGKYHENYNHRDTLETRLGVNAEPRPPLPEAWRETQFVLLANDAPTLQLAVLGQLHEPRFVLADTMNLWIETARKDLLRVAAHANLFVLNESEAELLSGESNLFFSGRKLLKETGARSVLVKKGEHGALLFHREGLFALPAYPVTDLRDPTGAGDSFAGALVGVLAALGRSDFTALKLAMLYATAVASLTVESFSCDRLESAGVTEIESRAAALREMTRLPG